MRSLEYASKEDLEELLAEEWMLDLLKKNPWYCSWGNYEDYMMESNNNSKGWREPTFFDTWKDFGPWDLDHLNELVNFYFIVKRSSIECDVKYRFPGYSREEDCGGANYETRQLDCDWYDFHQTGRRWCDKITQDEFDKLKEKGRLRDYDSLKAVNASEGMPHDAINRWICVEQRAKRLGVYGNCEKCEGSGHVYTADEAHVELQLWFILPRKGCSRGVLIHDIKKDEVPEVINYLREAAKRNAERFGEL